MPSRTFAHDPKKFGKPLTESETEVMRQLARGATLQEIAKNIYLSINAINDRLGNARDKLGADTTVQAMHIWTKLTLSAQVAQTSGNGRHPVLKRLLDRAEGRSDDCE